MVFTSVHWHGRVAGRAEGWGTNEADGAGRSRWRCLADRPQAVSTRPAVTHVQTPGTAGGAGRTNAGNGRWCRADREVPCRTGAVLPPATHMRVPSNDGARSAKTGHGLAAAVGRGMGERGALPPASPSHRPVETGDEKRSRARRDRKRATCIRKGLPVRGQEPEPDRHRNLFPRGQPQVIRVCTARTKRLIRRVEQQARRRIHQDFTRAKGRSPETRRRAWSQRKPHALRTSHTRRARSPETRRRARSQRKLRTLRTSHVPRARSPETRRRARSQRKLRTLPGRPAAVRG
jgi:hypothetical protein